MIPLSNEIGVRELTQPKAGLKRLWRDINEAFTAPITYHSGGWEDTVPVELKKEVVVQRLAQVLNGGWETGTNAEATCYLSTACMVFPFDQDWTDIYCWLVGQWMPVAYESLEFIPTDLRRDQVAQLEGLKRDIRSKQKSRRSKRKEDPMTTDAPESTSESTESLTFVGTIVIKMMPEGINVMVGKDDTDPHITVMPATDLGNVFEALPGIMENAEAKWAENPRNPKYTKPKAPRKKAAPKSAATSEPASSTTTTPAPEEGTTPELPLLESSTPEEPETAPPLSDEVQGALRDADEAEAKRDAAAAPVEPEPAQMAEGSASLLHQKPEEDTTVTEEPTNIADHQPAESEATEFKCAECGFSAFTWRALEDHYEAFSEHRPEEASAGADAETDGADAETHEGWEGKGEPSAEETGVETPEAETTEEPTTTQESAPAAASTGQWLYYLKDTGDDKLNGLGPFYNTGDALDELGVSKEGRGKYWHRWDRLPKTHQDRIERKREE